MKPLIPFITLLLLAALAQAATGNGFARETPVYKTADNRKLHLHIEKPAGWKSTDPHPAVVFFFDGGWGNERVGNRYEDFSPAHHITSAAPPTVVFLGGKDALISVAVLERFNNNMTKAAVRGDTHIYEGQPHGFFNQVLYKTATLVETDKFLSSLGWLTGEPALTTPVIKPSIDSGTAKTEADDARLVPSTPAEDLKGKWTFTADPKLPNVLIIGDSISIGYPTKP